MEYRDYYNDCFDLYTIKTDKFDNIHMEVIFENNLTKENMTYLSMLGKILSSSNKSYPKEKLFIRKLEDLYSLGFTYQNRRVGKTIFTNLIIDSIDSSYMAKDAIDDILKFTFECIFNPLIDVDEFDKDIFLKAKDETEYEIESIYEDYKYKTLIDAFEDMGDDIRSINNSGYLDILEEMTPKKLYEFYKKFIDESKVIITVCGNLDMDEINKKIKKYSQFRCLNNSTYDYYLDYIPLKRFKDTRWTDTRDINLVEVYSFKRLTDFEREYVMPLFNLLWGSGSLNSVLYNNLRGENSLCYNIETIYDKYDRVLTCETLIDSKNLKRVIEVSRDSLSGMKSGYITKELLSNTKNIIKKSLNSIYDNPSKLLDDYLFVKLGLQESIDKRMDNYSKINIDDITNLSKKIKLVMVYEGDN